MAAKAIERQMAEQGLAKPVPPGNHFRLAGMHWLERIITDGIGDGLTVLQWQPGVKQWCRPNHYATYGNEIDTSHYIYVGPCVLPPDEENIVKLKDLIRELDSGNQVAAQCHSKYIRIDRDNYQFLRDLLHSMV